MHREDQVACTGDVACGPGCCSVDKKLCYRLCVILGGTTLTSRELLSNLLEFFLRGVSVRALFGFVSSRRAYYGLVRPFSISVFFPVVKRGKSCSGIRGLGIGIRA